jgi:hypothetical protein
MAQIDLKNCDIYFLDGFSGSGAVNNAAGYAAGAVTMAMDGYTGEIPLNATFTVPGDTTTYQVTAKSETTGNTTSITFTPALAASVADNDVITFGGRQLNIRVGEGNLSWTEAEPREYKLDRGRLYTVRNADEVPVDVSMELMWEFLKSGVGEPPTPREVLYKTGNASSWQTAATDTCAPYAIDIKIVHTPPCEDEPYEVYTLPEFRHESVQCDLKGGMLSLSGKCNVTKMLVDRVTRT